MRRALVLAVLLAPAVAQANGRFPQTVGVHFKPGDHSVMALAVSWGLITTTDGGATWQWNCEDAIGFGGVYDPDYAFTSTGLLLATTTSTDGMRMTRDRCTWTQAPPPLGSADGTSPATFVAQVEVGADGAIYAAAATATDSQIYVSTNDGVSFAARSLPGGAHTDWWESMVVAPSTSGATTRIYLSGYNLPNGTKQRVLYRSDDAGTTWTPLPTTDFTFGGDATDLQIVAVSPMDPDLVFAKVKLADGQNTGDDLYRTTTGGSANPTWTRVVQSTQNITSVLVENDGNTVLYSERPGSAGLPNPGPVHTSTNKGASFDAGITGKEVECLAQRDDGTLYACGNSFDPDDMALGTGSPSGWTPILTFSTVTKPVSCPAGTPQHDVCEVQRWPTLVCQFGITYPGVNCGTIDAGTGPDAGLVHPPSNTCGSCASSGGGTWLLSVLVVVPLVRRRRRP
jgi:MYXO-CTERM domain-containing protein